MVGFSWVIKDELAGMAHPGLMAPLDQDLAWLKREGVGAVISLTETVLDVSAEVDFDLLHVPIPDMMSPTIVEIEEIVSFTETAIAQGKPVAMHCLAGRGRTGTLLACFLVHRGVSPESAIEVIRSQRPGSIETQTQMMTVFDYAAYLADQETSNTNSHATHKEYN